MQAPVRHAHGLHCCRVLHAHTRITRRSSSLFGSVLVLNVFAADRVFLSLIMCFCRSSCFDADGVHDVHVDVHVFVMWIFLSLQSVHAGQTPEKCLNHMYQVHDCNC